jgi:hypothetical protein
MPADDNYQNDLSKVRHIADKKSPLPTDQHPEQPLEQIVRDGQARGVTDELSEGFGIPQKDRQDISAETAGMQPDPPIKK